ncbi:uncharacterized protein LOC134261605 [Saccostrea cucullata]|uniref:uncharacterized protein LOC134261605 n=1 Tax=Saccostrea cuccullata TaxID=36930 RepID=UPI002ED4D3EB
MDFNEISSDNNDDISLDMSDGSSVFDEQDGVGIELGTRPYQFEPEADSDEELVDEDDIQPSEDERLGNTDWCTCEQCVAMPNAEECVCCQEIPEIRCVTEEDHRHCITQHNGFSPVCLHPSVLRTAYHSYRQQYAELPETNG